MRSIILGVAAASILTLAGCGGMGTTKFVHPEFNFGFMEKVAVVPFENISSEQGAGARATRYFTASLLSAEAFEIVEPGEVANALSSFAINATAQLTEAQSVKLGQDLGAQGLFLGSLSELSQVRSGSNSVTVVTVVVRLVETETGATVWSATHTEDSSTFWSSLFGARQRPSSEVLRRCVNKCLDTLLD